MSPRETSLFQDEGAQALQDQLEVFASHWISGLPRASVPGELAAFRNLTTVALVRAAEKWNYDRNSLRRLPVEILEHCWSFLGTADLVRAARVCRAWNEMLYATPALWTDITFYANPKRSFKPLDVLLGRSKERLIRVSITGFTSDKHHDGLVDALEIHRHRLYQLDIHDLMNEDPYRASPMIYLQFVAPVLRSYTCRNSAVEPILRGSCPKLQILSVTSLRDVEPSQSITSLEFLHWDTLDHLYTLFPRLVRLKISCTDALKPLALPKGSIPDSLQHVILRHFDVSYEELCDFGFTNIRKLEYEGASLDATLALFARLGATPRSAEIDYAHTILADAPVASGQPARTFRFSLFPIPGPDYYASILGTKAVCENITSLTILPYGLWCNGEGRFILPQGRFPALKTLKLVLSAANRRKPPSHALLNLEVMPRSGCLRAPALRRLVISRFRDDRGFERHHRVEPIPPLAIVVFLERHVELAPGRQLEELALDGDNGIRLCEMDKNNDSLQILESHVGKISYYCKDAPRTMV